MTGLLPIKYYRNRHKCHMPWCDDLVIETKSFRFKFPRSCFTAYRKSPRGPKKPRPKCEGTTKASHVSTAKLLRNLKVNAATP
jgi:hypothetical protein